MIHQRSCGLAASGYFLVISLAVNTLFNSGVLALEHEYLKAYL